ncbi:MAG: AAA family ATPase [Deltaproteobacteria bacterium]|nr:MAG: AAA family ATPase [Deltaproteobacteria bacterium]
MSGTLLSLENLQAMRRHLRGIPVSDAPVLPGIPELALAYCHNLLAGTPLRRNVRALADFVARGVVPARLLGCDRVDPDLLEPPGPRRGRFERTARRGARSAGDDIVVSDPGPVRDADAGAGASRGADAADDSDGGEARVRRRVRTQRRRPRDRDGDDATDPYDLTTRQLCRVIRAHLRAIEPVPVPRPPDPLRRNLQIIADAVGLSDVDTAIVQFLVVLHHARPVPLLANMLDTARVFDAAYVVSVAIQADVDDVVAALAPESRLVDTGIVTIDDDEEYELQDKFELKEGIAELAVDRDLTPDILFDRFFSLAPEPTLTIADFEHLSEQVALVRRLLSRALRAGERGINVLFCGPTGTGKTELARAIAADIGVPLYAVGCTDEDGDSASPGERLSSLRMAQRLLPDERALVLFDELEDLFEWREPMFGGRRPVARTSMSKKWFNDLLETNRIPTLWITNRAEGIDPAFLRRFAYAIEFGALDARCRARILARHINEDDRITEDDLVATATRFDVNAALYETAVRSARIASDDGRVDRDTLERCLEPLTTLVTGKSPADDVSFDPRTYDVDAACADTDLRKLADRLANWQPTGRHGLTLCLFGPPGTGKSGFARYLAHRMGRPVEYRRASDILSMWVGETEKAIKAIFRRAADSRAVLLLDEVDSFLRSRDFALQRWEVSHCNEFLQQLESYRGVVACTTNLWRDLDPAVVRRFLFKIEFKWLRPPQAAALFARHFRDILDHPLDDRALAAVERDLARLPRLAPGDFAVVARRYRALGVRADRDQLVAELELEHRIKPAARTAAGFR